jgi:hypothetical protein
MAVASMAMGIVYGSGNRGKDFTVARLGRVAQGLSLRQDPSKPVTSADTDLPSPRRDR